MEISSTFHLHNTKPTHGRKNIDVLVSDMAHLFQELIIIQNVRNDIPDGQPGRETLGSPNCDQQAKAGGSIKTCQGSGGQENQKG